MQGRRGGTCPPPAIAARFDYWRPPEIAQASRTQWEFLFAHALNKPVRLFRAANDMASELPISPDQEFTDRQAAWLAWMDATLDKRWSEFHSVGELLMQVDKIEWRFEPPAPRQPIGLPYPSLGFLFKGRDEFLSRLQDSLARENGGSVAIVSKAVHGTGGTGKTRAAVEYAWAHRDAYSALLFAQAATPDSLETNLRELAAPLRLREASEPNPDLKLQAVLAWPRNHPRWFLILDDVDTETVRDAASHILGQLSGGHVVLTSRLDAGLWDFAEPLDLDILGLDDAALLLREATDLRRTKHPEDAAQSLSLAEDLGRLALALTLAVATIRVKQCSFAEYRVMWTEAREKVREWNESVITGYHTAVGQTWQTSVALVSDPARVLLERLAFLRSASTTSPGCCKTPTGSTRRNC
jgi:hypothetical protein